MNKKKEYPPPPGQSVPSLSTGHCSFRKRVTRVNLDKVHSVAFYPELDFLCQSPQRL